MARILQNFVFVSAMMAAASSQRDYTFYRTPRVMTVAPSRQISVNKRVSFEEEPKPKDVIVFQGPANRRGERVVPMVPEHCKRQGFCEDEPEYPTELVKGVVDSLDQGQGVRFQMDKLDDTVQIAQRLGGAGAEPETELCNSTEKVIFPQSAPDSNGTWYTVINFKEKPLQGVRVELCNTSGTLGCKNLVTMAKGFVGGCKQKYFYRMLDVIDENGKHVTKHLKLPSCCSCVAIFQDDLYK